MIRIVVREKGGVSKVLSGLPQRLRAALMQAMQDSALHIQSLAKVYSPVFRGLLRVSIAQSVAEEGDRIVGEVGSGVVYAQVIEEGRNPWPGPMPPPEQLRVWARRRGVAPFEPGWDMGFVLARAIKARGFRAQPYLRPALLAAAPRVQALFQARILEALRQEGGKD